MKLKTMITRFRNDENGAVTVDWVVLTAAIVGLGLAVMMALGTGITETATGIATSVSTQEAPTFTTTDTTTASGT